MNTAREHAKNIRNRIARHRERRIGAIKRKILLLLLSGVSIGLSGSPRTTWKVIGELRKEWREINKQTAERAVNTLYASKLVGVEEGKTGELTLILNEKGRKKALTYNLMYMKIPIPSMWDRIWRIVSFDIPEDEKPVRNAIREHLLKLGFCELQQSVLVYPFDCLKEVIFITELHDAKKYVRYILATYIDNEEELKNFFNLS